MIVTECLEEYFALMQKKPELFSDSSVCRIVTDQGSIEKFQRENNRKIGVIYKSCFNTLVVDLIAEEDRLFAYERVIPTASGRGVVCIPIIDDKFLMVNQYRHCIRSMQLCFPRGFGEEGLTSEENARKELWEETGAQIVDCQFLGSITPDSGLVGAECDVYLLRITSYDTSFATEGIIDMQLISPGELEEKIRLRQISDSFTLSAYLLLKTSNIIF